MTVVLYNIPELNVERNNMIRFSVLQQRDEYFSHLPFKSYSDVQIGRKQNPWDISIDITLYDDFREPQRNYNYAKIVDDGKSYFYFILGWKEQGSNQVIYNLQLDTLFMAFGVVGQNELDLDVTSNPQLITREHRDRFNFNTNRAYFNDVPESGDNTNPVVLTNTVLEATANVRARLVYKNRTDAKPVAYPYVETAMSVPVVGADWIGTIISTGVVTASRRLYMWDGDFDYTETEGTPNINVSVASTEFIKFEYEPSAPYASRFARYSKSTGNYLGQIAYGVSAEVKIRVGNQSTNILVAAPYHVGTGTIWSDIIANFPIINYAASSTKALPLWTDIDQYDAMTDRIIEVPYFNQFAKTFYEDGYGIFVPLEEENYTQPDYSMKYRPTGTFDMSKVDKLRVKYNEPKLYTSQFAPILLNMNGLAIGLKREAYNNENGLLATTPTGIRFSYEILTPSTFNIRINPSLAYILNDVDELRKTWSVSNEIASIKDEAYTYNQYFKDLDDKQRNIQESAATRNAYLNTVNQALGVTGGMIAGGAKITPQQLGARIGQAGINVVQTFMELADKMKLNKIQAEQKYITMLLASTQISGASLKFIKSFNGDKIREVQFGLRGHELEYWDNYFHRFGYEALDFKPITFRSRKYFNHIKASLDFKKKPYGLTSQAVEDIKNRFLEGVTVYHPIGGGSSIEINFTQDKENWEL